MNKYLSSCCDHDFYKRDEDKKDGAIAVSHSRPALLTTYVALL